MSHIFKKQGVQGSQILYVGTPHTSSPISVLPHFQTFTLSPPAPLPPLDIQEQQSNRTQCVQYRQFLPTLVALHSTPVTLAVSLSCKMSVASMFASLFEYIKIMWSLDHPDIMINEACLLLSPVLPQKTMWLLTCQRRVHLTAAPALYFPIKINTFIITWSNTSPFQT